MYGGEGRRIRTSFALTAAVIGCLLAPAAAAAQGEATTNVVSCTPNSILVGVATSCSATVQDVSPDGAQTPTGSIDFSSDTPGGAFKDPDHPADSVSSCPLQSVGEEHAASCRLLYVPGTFGTGVHEISASYPGDAEHDPSSDVTDVDVSKHPSVTSIACAPGSITLGAGTSTCVVTVMDSSAVASTPSGSVTLSSASGSFGSGCAAMSPVGTDQASCTAVFTPLVAGMSSLSGTYGGDGSHEASTGTAQVSIASALKPPAARKKCRKKRTHRAAAAKKKKCKKKKGRSSG